MNFIIFICFPLFLTTSQIYNSFQQKWASCFTKKEKYEFEKIDFSKNLKLVLFRENSIEIIQYKPGENERTFLLFDISYFLNDPVNEFNHYKNDFNTIFFVKRDKIDYDCVDGVINKYNPINICYIVNDNLFFDEKNVFLEAYTKYWKDPVKLKNTIIPYFHFLLDKTHTEKIDDMIFREFIEMIKDSKLERFYDVFQFLCSYDAILNIDEVEGSLQSILENNREAFKSLFIKYCSDDFYVSFLTEDELKIKKVLGCLKSSLSKRKKRMLDEKLNMAKENNSDLKMAHTEETSAVSNKKRKTDFILYGKEVISDSVNRYTVATTSSNGVGIRGFTNQTPKNMTIEEVKENLKCIKGCFENPIYRYSTVYLFFVLRNRGKLFYDILFKFYDLCSQEDKKYSLEQVRYFRDQYLKVFEEKNPILNKEIGDIDKQNVIKYVVKILSDVMLFDHDLSLEPCLFIMEIIIVSLVETDYSEFLEGLTLFFSILSVRHEKMMNICNDVTNKYIEEYRKKHDVQPVNELKVD